MTEQTQPSKVVINTSYKYSTNYGKEAWSSSMTIEHSENIPYDVLLAYKYIAEAQNIVDVLYLAIRKTDSIEPQEIVSLYDTAKDLKTLAHAKVSANKDLLTEEVKDKLKVQLSSIKNSIIQLKEDTETYAGVTIQD